MNSALISTKGDINAARRKAWWDLGLLWSLLCWPCLFIMSADRKWIRCTMRVNGAFGLLSLVSCFNWPLLTDIIGRRQLYWALSWHFPWMSASSACFGQLWHLSISKTGINGHQQQQVEWHYSNLHLFMSRPWFWVSSKYAPLTWYGSKKTASTQPLLAWSISSSIWLDSQSMV